MTVDAAELGPVEEESRRARRGGRITVTFQRWQVDPSVRVEPPVYSQAPGVRAIGLYDPSRRSINTRWDPAALSPSLWAIRLGWLLTGACLAVLVWLARRTPPPTHEVNDGVLILRSSLRADVTATLATGFCYAAMAGAASAFVPGALRGSALPLFLFPTLPLLIGIGFFVSHRPVVVSREGTGVRVRWLGSTKTLPPPTSASIERVKQTAYVRLATEGPSMRVYGTMDIDSAQGALEALSAYLGIRAARNERWTSQR